MFSIKGIAPSLELSALISLGEVMELEWYEGGCQIIVLIQMLQSHNEK